MPPWLSSLFVHPEFVIPGLALLSLPVLIHLINRLRYRRVRWAAMEFLLASQRRNRRRVLLEQLLLLLLRMLAVVGVVLLVARPLLDPERFSLFQGSRTQHLVLLDDSGSMRDRWGDTTAFDAAKDVVRQLVAEGERRPDTQALTLLVASNPDQPLLNQQPLNTELAGRIDTLLKSLPCSHRTVDLASATQSARQRLLEHKASARMFHLISDFREADWGEATAVIDVLCDMDREKIAVHLVRAVSESHGNLGVTDLNGAVDVAAAGVPLRLSATVRNFGEQAAKDVRLAVYLDGRKLPTTEIIETLEAQSESTREFDVLFAGIGPHDVRVELPADALDQDNSRFLALDLPDANPVLIIDGSPGGSEAFYLADALAPTPGLTGFAPSIETPEYLRRRSIERFQSVFLLNVAELPPDAVRTLEQFVAAGGGLAWYLGDQVRAAFYNDKQYRDGRGLFPARLASISELAVDDTNPAADLSIEPHPLFRVLEGADNPFIDLVKINRYFSVARNWAAPDGVRVIASLRNKAPLMLEHRFGRGTVVTCLTALGLGWNNWPQIPPAFVALQLEIAKHIARGDHGQELKQVGEPIAFSLDPATYLPQVEVRPPGGGAVSLTLGVKSAADRPGSGAGEGPPASSAITGVSRYADGFAQTDTPGLYEVRLKRQDGGEEIRRFAYNAPESEGQLKIASTEMIRRRIGPGTQVALHEAGELSWRGGEESGREIHDTVLVVLLMLLLVEQALALRLSYHPRPAGGRP
ncbi:MAG: BatA domain-containing protein [Planctomycetaceae bacterium]